MKLLWLKSYIKQYDKEKCSRYRQKRRQPGLTPFMRQSLCSTSHQLSCFTCALRDDTQDCVKNRTIVRPMRIAETAAIVGFT